jgi:hypothetical protein
METDADAEVLMETMTQLQLQILQQQTRQKKYLQLKNLQQSNFSSLKESKRPL